MNNADLIWRLVELLLHKENVSNETLHNKNNNSTKPNSLKQNEA